MLSNHEKYKIASSFLVVVIVILSFLSCKTLTKTKDNDSLSFSTDVDTSIFDKISKNRYKLDSSYVKNIINKMSESEHPFGSKEQEKLKDFIVNEINNLGSQAEVMNFSYTTPVWKNPNQTETKKGFNIIAKPLLKNKKDCTILVGSHYDSKKISSGKCLGANDSGSSSALLLDFLRYINTELKDYPVECSISFVWLDGEESVLEGWSDWSNYYHLDQDNTYGSRFLVKTLKKCNKPYSKYCLYNEKGEEKEGEGVAAFVLFDMIGSENIKLSNDVNSDEDFKALFKNIWYFYHSERIYDTPYTYLEDDHIPFVNRNISKVIDIIDLYNTEFWHNDKDNPENVSIPTMEKVSIVGIDFLLNLVVKQ